MATATTHWPCPACTFVNASDVAICKLCFTGRGAGNVAAASAASSNSPATTMMTPPLLSQTWRSHGRSSRATSLATFSQRSLHVFSNYATHPPVTFGVPSYCHSTDLISSGRGARINFQFAEKAIMACKAALFRDYAAFDRIVGSNNHGEAKALGRQVKSFDQHVWDAHQCSITRDVTIAKMLGWEEFRSALLKTGNNLIAECTAGDWVWGTALKESHGDVHYPGRWRGMNVLGWSLMEARDEAVKFVQQQQQPQFSAMPSAPSMKSTSVPSAPATDSTEAPKRQRTGSNDDKLSPNSIKYLAPQYLFGPKAFGQLQQSTPDQHATNLPDLSHLVKEIVEASAPGAKHLRGERGNKYVTRMLADIYQQGLFMHGSSDSSVNRTIIPAFRRIISELNKLDAQNAKRVSMVRDLVDACQDCQQVQARTILCIYADLTRSHAVTLDSQLRYSLVRSKEAALHVLITKYHSPSCDHDHTQVSPQQQRAHLWSGYVALIGDEFGLDGVVAANGDRFLNASLGVIRTTHGPGSSSSTSNKGGIFGVIRNKTSSNSNVGVHANDQLKKSIIDELTQNLCVKEWVTGLIGDINNQSADADRIIDRSCIFSFATAHSDGGFNHRIFYDEARVEEYSDLDPKEPTDDNQYEPFLSPVVLVEMLVKAGMLKQDN